MNYTETPEKFDEVVKHEGEPIISLFCPKNWILLRKADFLDLEVIVDSKALMVLVGTRMDYIDDEIRSEFIFENPNAKGTCGCGESFHV